MNPTISSMLHYFTCNFYSPSIWKFNKSGIFIPVGKSFSYFASPSYFSHATGFLKAVVEMSPDRIMEISSAAFRVGWRKEAGKLLCGDFSPSSKVVSCLQGLLSFCLISAKHYSTHAISGSDLSWFFSLKFCSKKENLFFNAFSVRPSMFLEKSDHLRRPPCSNTIDNSLISSSGCQGPFFNTGLR